MQLGGLGLFALHVCGRLSDTACPRCWRTAVPSACRPSCTADPDPFVLFRGSVESFRGALFCPLRGIIVRRSSYRQVHRLDREVFVCLGGPDLLVEVRRQHRRKKMLDCHIPERRGGKTRSRNNILCTCLVCSTSAGRNSVPPVSLGQLFEKLRALAAALLLPSQRRRGVR